jgi:hypothetical protein
MVLADFYPQITQITPRRKKEARRSGQIKTRGRRELVTETRAGPTGY